MQAIKIPLSIPGVTHYVQMDEEERPPVDDVIAFARKSGAAHTMDGEEMFLVHLCDESKWCGMNRYTLNAGLTE